MSAATFSAPPTDGPLLLRIPEVMERAGLGRTSIYQEIAAGRLPVKRFGRAVRVHRDDLERWARGETSPRRHKRAQARSAGRSPAAA